MARAAQTAARFREAVHARDAGAIAALCAPEVVVHGPVTRRMAFHGRDEVRELFAVVIAHVDDIDYVDDLGDDDARVLTLRGRRGRHHYEEAVLMRVDASGAISEMRIYVRPLPGTVAMAAAFAPALARSRGLRVRAVLLTILLAPVRAMLLHGDALGVRLLGIPPANVRHDPPARDPMHAEPANREQTGDADTDAELAPAISDARPGA